MNNYQEWDWPEGKKQCLDGPWMNEPGKATWVDPETNLPCMILRNNLFAWCGYVGVESDHPLYGVEYDDMKYDGLAHGGITFTDKCQDGPEATAICHIPAEGHSDDVWWLGFDCLHAGDAWPELIALKNHPALKHIKDYDDYNVYRDVNYVKQETINLAKMVKEYSEENNGS